MARPPDIIARLHFYATKDGGRKGPTPADFYRCPLEFEGEKFDCALHLETVGSIAPGMSAIVPITLLCPGLIKPRLKIGSRFTLWEAGTIAEGVVEEIIPTIMSTP